MVRCIDINCYALYKVDVQKYEGSFMKISNNQLIGNLKVIGIICLLSLVGSNSAMAMKYRDNTIKLKSEIKGNELFSAIYEIEAVSLTPEQDPDEKIFVGLNKVFNFKGDTGEATFHVGRKNSSMVADWFNEEIDSDLNTITPKDFPNKLNFAVRGTLSLTAYDTNTPQNDEPKKIFVFKNIVIAQGHNYKSNNWWFGGKECFTHNFHSIRCIGRTDTGSLAIARFKLNGNKITLESFKLWG